MPRSFNTLIDSSGENIILPSLGSFDFIWHNVFPFPKEDSKVATLISN